MDKDFEILEYSTDLKLKSYGQSNEDLFANALKGLASVQSKECLDEETDVSRSIFVESIDPSTLLADFLCEVLSLSENNREVYTSIAFNELSDSLIDAELGGVTINDFDTEIKSILYLEVDIKEGDDGLEVTVPLEI